RLCPLSRRLFPRRTDERPGDGRGRGRRPLAYARLMGGRHGPDADHAVELPRLCRRLRAARTARHLDERGRRDRLDGELSGETRLDEWPALGFRGSPPASFTLSRADSSAPAPFSSFAARGVKRVDGAPWPESGSARLMILAGLNGPVFLVTSNFDVIKTYNNSTAYALAVGLLGDAIEGGPGLVARWPADP